ncbi:MFS general substrate transporter [Aspergillus ellipticus CBS 707.79]|uniref:MFS general substrate transporter n=1 Tax=Aspergillus ellipticus CBS 707.79 TaxID=1448320 RepID=A0A319F2H4_9EURO|nr:MFS general substrate transporter [Aspergillus ellipticus CBS 707.79]
MPTDEAKRPDSTISSHALEQPPTTHPFNEQTNYVPKRTIITIFLACSTIDLIATMDQTTLSTSLPTISTALHANDLTSWISSSFFLTSTPTQLLHGHLSDIFSRKAILTISLLLFFLGSLTSSLSLTATQLILSRALTGLGGGGLASLAQMIVSDVVPLRQRGKYQGILGAVVAIANGLGPVVGAALASSSPSSSSSSSSAESGNWRWIFRLNLLLTVIAATAVCFFMPLRKVHGEWRVKLRAVDFLGCGMVLAGTVGVVLGVSYAGVYAWGDGRVVGCLVAGGVFWAGFVGWEWKGARWPLVPVGTMFRTRIVRGASLTMFVNGWNLVVQSYFIPAFYQMLFGFGGVRAAAGLVGVVVLQTISSTLSGLVVHWTGRYREPILLGWIVWAVGLGLFSTLDETSGLGKQMGYAVLIGVGAGNTLQPSLIAIQAGVDRRDMATVTAFRNFTRNLGGTLGLAIAGTIINNHLTFPLPHTLSSTEKRLFLASPTIYLSQLPPDEAQQIREMLIPAYRAGFRVVFIVGAVLAAVAFAVAVGWMPQVGLSEGDEGGVVQVQEEGDTDNRVEKSRV